MFWGLLAIAIFFQFSNRVFVHVAAEFDGIGLGINIVDQMV